MTILCLGTLLAGLVAAPLIPFLPFACALLAAVVLGTLWTLLHGGAANQTALSAAVLLFACQIGYGLGIVGLALVGHALSAWRLGGEKRAPPAAWPLPVSGTADRPDPGSDVRAHPHPLSRSGHGA